MAEYERKEEFISKNGHEHEETTMGQKYGGLVPKKKPLISKDHERAFFDSADWALCKRTPRQRLPPRRPTCVSGRDNHGE
ncbi:uncharacterized protein LOC112521954 isoform X2 [Cynara cardunculus var. scolymus]|uniref:uncharacterized protein LOC112521954 isoform X2 n=1 Tax=Cynara cardunculus var. scolymus TaxID=59895 RepID=UPI000D62E01E|nr:uncharacterized protein LOC112521954 isoform X2 [Cynara cardunculus var. scolymus]